jgi:arylsulfatase A-like enzyme
MIAMAAEGLLIDGDRVLPARLQLVVGLLVLSAGLAACWKPGVAPPANVVVITLDTTRADRLSPYGFQDAAMPALEWLAREGVVFDQALSVAPLTLPAHASLFTGLFPFRHGVRDNADAPLALEFTTLAETMRLARFRTGAFVSSVVLAPERGVAQGFESYRDGSGERSHARGRSQRPGNEVVDDAIRWIDTVTDSRFLVWAHLYDPHRPYDPPEPYRSRHFDPYIGEIAFADAQIGRLLGALRDRRLLDRTMVIVAGDHGESLGEHGESDHGIFVYENVLRVPLIIKMPRVTASSPIRRVSSLVRVVDIMPTILDALNLSVPVVDGVSLMDLVRGTRATLDLEGYAESMYPERLGWSPLRTLRDSRYKVIEAPRPELYDLERDPFETRNLYDLRREVAEVMSKRLATIAPESPRFRGAAPASVPADLAQRLGALGYVARGRRALVRREADRPDPKDYVPILSGVPSAVTTSINEMADKR